MSSFQYVALIADEPIPGVPSHRVYGLFRHRDEAWQALRDAGIVEGEKPVPPFTIAGVLPMRLRGNLEQETP